MGGVAFTPVSARSECASLPTELSPFGGKTAVIAQITAFAIKARDLASRYNCGRKLFNYLTEHAHLGNPSHFNLYKVYNREVGAPFNPIKTANFRLICLGGMFVTSNTE